MGQFELREIAGRGAMGTVYRAYQRTMDRIVAVKILRSEIVKEPGVLRRFLREARAAARLQHPNIVTVHMVGETEDGVPYLVMEHIDGVSLEAICEAQGPQPLMRVISFGRQIAAALSEAHSLGIVHRDLKPANILVTDRSRTPDLVKVLDFGIAKLINTEADQSMMTADGTIFGTPHYIAPEQASGGDVDHRVDIYSLGVHPVPAGDGRACRSRARSRCRWCSSTCARSRRKPRVDRCEHPAGARGSDPGLPAEVAQSPARRRGAGDRVARSHRGGVASVQERAAGADRGEPAVAA